MTVPASCCDTASDFSKCAHRTNSDSSVDGFTKGCWLKFNEEIIEGNKDEIMYTGIVIIVVMVRYKNKNNNLRVFLNYTLNDIQ